LRPVIVFGMLFGAAWMVNANLNVPKYHVKDEKSALVTAEACNGKSEGLVFLDDDYSVGYDIRFKVEPLVIVVSPKIPKLEDLMQKFARGARNLNEIDGVLFTKGNETDSLPIKSQILADEGENFYEGHKLIRILYERCGTLSGLK
jgi:hypothetical protein